MRRKMLAGTTNVTEPIYVADTSSTTGAGLSGLVYNTSGLVCEYRRQGQSSWTTITLSAGTLGTASGSATLGTIIADGSLGGAYELGLPDNAFATSARWVVVRLRGAANMLPVQLFYELDAVNYQDGVHLGLTALPNTAVTTNGSLLTSGIGTDQLSVAAGKILLAAAGLDAITVETGVNARQALSPILAAAGGVLSGAGTTTIVIKAGANSGTTRITGTVDGSGNRTAVVLALPA